MEVFSLEFLGFLLIAIAFVTYRARKKRSGPTVIQGKRIAIRGQKISTPLERSTPLPCLLDDGKRYGDDFKDKTPPELPHAEGCRCELTEVVLHSHDLFNEKASKKKPKESFTTDLGELDRDTYRYYKYLLISNHQDSEETVQKEYADLAENIPIPEPLQEKIRNQIIKSDLSGSD